MSKKPFYAIAHRVLVARGVRDAIAHGANAIEVDLTAWKQGWYADHDGTITSCGDKAESLFKTIVAEDKKHQICFVWFDIKNPGYTSNPTNVSSIETLVRLGREILQKAGIKVLYGFYGGQTYGTREFEVICKGLNAMEAVSFSDKYNDVVNNYEKFGKNIPKVKRVMDYGLFDLVLIFPSILDELKKGVNGGFQNVFSWTYAKGQTAYMEKLVNAGVNGLIYGFKTTHYYDHHGTREPINAIKAHLNKTGSRLAAREDPLF